MPFTVFLLPSNQQLIVPDGDTILQAALKQGFYFPWGCDAGSCTLCEGRLLRGRVRLKNSGEILTPESSGADALLCCLAYPIENCEIEAKRVLGPGQFPVQTLSAKITRVEQMNADVKIVQFLLPAGKRPQFSAGQYLELLIDADTTASFSIGNAPRADRTLELHIRANPDSDSYPKLANRLREGEMIRMRLPMGDVTLHALQDAERILFLAGSTGFSQIKALLEALQEKADTRPIHLYWGGRHPQDLYLHDWVVELAARHVNLRYVPVISDDPAWIGRKGYVHKAVLEDITDFRGWKIVGGGSPGMVYAALDDFVAAGMKAEQMVSDVFAYAPR
ncbi:MAG TPA: 2Fe-2S iron-sulfur cluster-binding protein [Dongiaceae bacterium]|nr:2Fe-2S iron-sulfur cluster-binding protein [Dongiaceae bacterium]